MSFNITELDDLMPSIIMGNTDIAPGLVCELAGAQLHFVREPAVHVSRVPH